MSEAQDDLSALVKLVHKGELDPADELQELAEIPLEELPDRPPALFDHCKNTYDRMFEKAETREDGNIIYRGFLGRIIQKDLGLSTPMYTYVTRALKDMECIKSVKRGGGTTPSIWLLSCEPTLRKFNEINGTNKEDGKQKRHHNQDRYDRMEMDVVRLSNRVTDLENNLMKITDAMFSISAKVFESTTKTVVSERSIAAMPTITEEVSNDNAKSAVSDTEHTDPELPPDI